MKHIISLGAGVQSSVMALMAARGEITPMPECAIFADTGAEPKAVMRWLDKLEGMLPFPVHRVMTKAGLLIGVLEAIEKTQRVAGAPFFAKTKDGAAAPLTRSCTKEYKIDAIVKKQRELIGLKPRQRAPKEVVITQWIGISTDEATRMKDSVNQWITNRWPLIERRMDRYDCKRYLKKSGLDVPRSACTFCPYRDNKGWREMKMSDPLSWAQACMIDETVRKGFGGTKSELFVHRDLVPLAEVDLDTEEDRGQLDMFNNDCEGICGV